MKKILFILKYRESDYENGNVSENWAYTKSLSSGLLNSVRFVDWMLNNKLYEECQSKYVQVIDNSYIDKEVYNWKPDIVIIEAYWVVPEKMKELCALYPNIKWIVRNHSNIPFLSTEGIAMEWTLNYIKIPNLYIGYNHTNFKKDMCDIIPYEKLIYLPNYYKMSNEFIKSNILDHFYKSLKLNLFHDNFEKFLYLEFGDRPVKIGCFGAIRPLKNQLSQAIAAIQFAERYNVDIEFHINGNRKEGFGEPVLKNIRKLFQNHSSNNSIKLIEHNWVDHSDFIEIVKSMDIGLQVSYTETFNIVIADFVDNGIPVVTSDDIFWVLDKFKASCNDIDEIVNVMSLALNLSYRPEMIYFNRMKLHEYNINSINAWGDFIEEL